MKTSTPVVVAGMHRSGTSLVTSLLAAMGLDLGPDLLPADGNNRLGYFESRDFLELNRRMVAACCDPAATGHVDWGWTETESFDSSYLGAFEEEVRQLLASRSEQEGAWGFKDPRSALLLDFWRELLPEARYLFVFRHYGLVVQSLLRRQRTPKAHLLQVARFARVWKRYNEDLLRFYEAHPDDCLLVEVFDLLGCSLRVIEHANEQWGFHLRPLDIKDVAEDRLLSRDGPLWFDGLCRMTTRGLDPVYERLQQAGRSSLERIGHAARLAG